MLNILSVYFYLFICKLLIKIPTSINIKKYHSNYLGGDPVVRAWNQEVCSLCGLRFEPWSCSYDDHWRLTWSLTSGLVGLVEVDTS